MPDHIHMILFIDTKWRTQFAPTISRVVNQFKGAVTQQLGGHILANTVRRYVFPQGYIFSYYAYSDKVCAVR